MGVIHLVRSSRDADDHLIAGYVGGESFALHTVDRWIEVVLRRDYHSLAGEWDDLRQEVRTRVFHNLSRGAFRGDSDLRTYIHQITKNVCVDQLRGRQKNNRALAAIPVPESPSAPEVSQQHVSRNLLERMLRDLSARDQKLLYLVHVECLSYAEVAGKLGISEGAVKLRMFRCRRRILKRQRRLLRLTNGG